MNCSSSLLQTVTKVTSAALMLNGTEGTERQLKISCPSLLMWKGRRKKEGSVGMVIYPTGKAKTLYSCCNPQKSCFCLMPFHTFLLTVGWAVFLLGCLGWEMLSVMSHIAVHRVLMLGWELIPWAAGDISRGWEKAGAGWFILCLLFLPGCVSCSGSFQPYSWADHWGKGTGKAICIPTLHLKAINYRLL